MGRKAQKKMPRKRKTRKTSTKSIANFPEVLAKVCRSGQGAGLRVTRWWWRRAGRERRVLGSRVSSAYIVESLDLELNLILVIAGILVLASCASLLFLLLGNRLIPAQTDGRRGQLAGALLLAQIILTIDQQLRLEGVFANILILVSATVVEHEADDLQLRRPHSIALKV